MLLEEKKKTKTEKSDEEFSSHARTCTKPGVPGKKGEEKQELASVKEPKNTLTSSFLHLAVKTAPTQARASIHLFQSGHSEHTSLYVQFHPVVAQSVAAKTKRSCRKIEFNTGNRGLKSSPTLYLFNTYKTCGVKTTLSVICF